MLYLFFSKQSEKIVFQTAKVWKFKSCSKQFSTRWDESSLSSHLWPRNDLYFKNLFSLKIHPRFVCANFVVAGFTKPLLSLLCALDEYVSCKRHWEISSGWLQWRLFKLRSSWNGTSWVVFPAQRKVVLKLVASQRCSKLGANQVLYAVAFKEAASLKSDDKLSAPYTTSQR